MSDRVTRKICRYLSTDVALYTAIAMVITLFMPWEWWARVFLMVLIPPGLYLRMKFVGDPIQLWKWKCGDSADTEGTRSGGRD